MKYLTKSKKSIPVVLLIEEAIDILISVGIPVANVSVRTTERMAMALLAVAGVTTKWVDAKGYEEQRFLKTREIITFINTHFEENISSGSYDDIRRKDLKLLVLAGLVLNSANNLQAATNDPTRGYCLESGFRNLIQTYKTLDWETNLNAFLANTILLAEKLARDRNFEKIPVLLPNKEVINFSLGEHNVLQKLIVEEFLPRYGFGCKILYIGDTAKKLLHLNKDELNALKFFELAHDKLPDIIAYSKSKNWLYLIEAVHSSGSINELRRLELKTLSQNCTAEIIFVTAFLSRNEFRKWSSEIAWETEVWIADNPDHLIHFNGDKFLGPYIAS